LVCASTLDNNVAPSAESVFVRTENSEIQRLISVRPSGRKSSVEFCYFPSLRMENSKILAVNFHPCGQKIAKFNCKFPSIWTENSIYMGINFRPYGRKNSE